MTAIAYVYTSDGFVVGADGLGVNAKTKDAMKRNVIKLFPLIRPGINLVCGWAGAASIQAKDGRAFNFSEETERIQSVLANKQFTDDALECAVEFGSELYSRLLSEHGPVLQFPALLADGIVASALLAGYVKVGRYKTVISTCSKIEFGHDDGKLRCPQITTFGMDDHLQLFTGHDDLWREIKRSVLPPLALREAEELVKLYLDRCASNNPAVYGGHIHIATVTRQKFAWSIPPQRCAPQEAL
jgi:hypothetical protein